MDQQIRCLLLLLCFCLLSPRRLEMLKRLACNYCLLVLDVKSLINYNNRMSYQ